MSSSKRAKDYEMLNSPIKWVGGKSRLRKQIIALLPTHSCYVEPFAGAAWVLFGKQPSPVEVLNDIDQELINFWRVVKLQPDELIASFEWELVSRAEFERLANLDPSSLDNIQRAHRFYYLIMAGWGGELNYPRFQTSIKDGGHGNRLIGALKTLQQRLSPIHERLQTVIIENLTWQECIDRYDREGVVMYLDPPYPGNGANYAHNMRDWAQHRLLVERLNVTKCKWLLSSYDIPEVRDLDLFEQHFITPIESYSGMAIKKNDTQRVLNKEVVVTNFHPSENLAAPPDKPLQFAMQLDKKE
jgi:DNA adenine methylase